MKQEEFEALKKDAEKGDAQSQNDLAVCYELGEGVEQSFEKAAEWYKKAAKQGHEDAGYCLAVARAYGNALYI